MVSCHGELLNNQRATVEKSMPLEEGLLHTDLGVFAAHILAIAMSMPSNLRFRNLANTSPSPQCWVDVHFTGNGRKKSSVIFCNRTFHWDLPRLPFRSQSRGIGWSPLLKALVLHCSFVGQLSHGKDLKDLHNFGLRMTDWWFGTFFILPYIGNNHPNWLSYFSEG